VRAIHAQIHDPEWHEKNNSLKGDNYDYAYFKRFGYEDIGLDKKYETMVFSSMPANDEEKCCPFRIDSSKDSEMESYNSASDAYEGHLKLCEKYSKIE